MNAYGAGDSVRAVVDHANVLAERHDVALVSAVRTRETPAHPLHPRVRVIPLTDLRQAPRPHGPVRTLPHRRGLATAAATIAPTAPPVRPGRPPYERAVVDYLRALGGGVLVGTDPALSVLAARYTPATVVRVAAEPAPLDSHKPGLIARIRRWYPGLDAVVVSTGAEEEAYRRALAEGRAQLVRIPRGLPPRPRRRASLGGEVVVAAGSLVKSAGFDQLVEAFAHVARTRPGWRLHIYGTGGRRARLLRRIRRHGLERMVTVRGDASAFYDEIADASIHVGGGVGDGHATSILEAMAHGVPVVAFDHPYGSREIITHRRDGLLVPPGDVAALETALGRLVDDAALRRRMGAHAYDTAVRYGPRQVGARWETLLAELSTLTRLRPALL